MSALSAVEACKKLCPFKLAGPLAGDDMLCDADRCMGWLWTDHALDAARAPVGHRPKGLGWAKRPHVDGGVVWVRRRSDSDRVGLCGACERRPVAAPSVPPLRVLTADECEPG